MSRNFHNLHVHAPSQKKRDQVVKAILAYAKQAGFERVKRVTDADRVIRLGGRAPWFSVEDDAYGAPQLARVIAKATKLPVLEAYCEASAIVWLGLYADGKRAGGWGNGKRPPVKTVERLLARGSAAELARKWDDAIKQVFPESALAVAGKQFGIGVRQFFGETNPRTVVIALARTKPLWKPRYQTGAPGFYVGWGSNSGFERRHLVFEGETVPHRVQVMTTGGPGRGLCLTFSGSALEGGHLEILSVSHERLQLVRDGNTWRDPAAEIPPDFVEQPDLWTMGPREMEKIDPLRDERSWYLDVSYRAVKEGACELVTDAATADGKATARGALNLHVMWKPWRPSVAHEHVTNEELFAMHRTDRAIAYITLRGTLAEAWAWARQPAETWSRMDAHRTLQVMRDLEVVLREEYPEGEAAPLDKVAPAFPDKTTTAFQAASTSWMFGTHSRAPSEMDPREKLAVHLVLTSDRDEHVAVLAELCDEAIARGVAHSALIVQQQYNPEMTTAFEELALRDDTVTRLAAWHETHLRGVDRRIWLSTELAQRLDRARLPDYATVTELGRGLRIQVPDDRRRSELEPLIAALGALVPTEAEARRWTLARAGDVLPNR